MTESKELRHCLKSADAEEVFIYLAKAQTKLMRCKVHDMPDYGGLVWFCVPQEVIERDTGLTRKRVRQSLELLEKKRLINIDSKGGSGTFRPSSYAFTPFGMYMLFVMADKRGKR